MNLAVLPEIPRLYTALAEWLACVFYIIPLKKRFSPGVTRGILAAALVVQGLELQLTGGLAIPFWMPSMMLAVGLMFGCIRLCCAVTANDAGYTCARAFITAEFAASLEWQLYCLFVWKPGAENRLASLACMAVVYAAVFAALTWLHTRNRPEVVVLNIRRAELASAVAIALSAFAMSNFYFLVHDSEIAGQSGEMLFFIRTLVDFSGIVMLYAQQEQRNDLRWKNEAQALDDLLHRQYDQYQQGKENIQQLNQKYHDLKYQLQAIRAEKDPEKKESYLSEMEQMINTYKAKSNTGNRVLDVVMTGKNMYCAEHGITITSVIDGGLLNFMNSMDLSTLFGNALDNAVESVETLPDPDKRLIRVAVFAKNSLVMIRFENYCEQTPQFENGLPLTTKPDTAFHGFGLKSIKAIAQKYGGSMTVHAENSWFSLRILIPRSEPQTVL